MFLCLRRIHYLLIKVPCNLTSAKNIILSHNMLIVMGEIMAVICNILVFFLLIQAVLWL